MEIAAFAVSIVAVLVAGGAVWHARGQVAADRAADAAEATLEVARAAEHHALADAERDQVDWGLERTSQQVFVLRNHGSGSAYVVRGDTADLGVGEGNQVYFEEFGGPHFRAVLSGTRAGIDDDVSDGDVAPVARCAGRSQAAGAAGTVLIFGHPDASPLFGAVCGRLTRIARPE